MARADLAGPVERKVVGARAERVVKGLFDKLERTANVQHTESDADTTIPHRNRNAPAVWTQRLQNRASRCHTVFQKIFFLWFFTCLDLLVQGFYGVNAKTLKSSVPLPLRFAVAVSTLAVPASTAEP